MKPASKKVFSLTLPTVELPKSAVQLMSVCVMSAALAACGGSSGGTTVGEETGGTDTDTDINGLLDSGEVISFGEFTPSDADPDGDGLFEADEILLGTSSLDADSDGDGIFDGDEDSDGDGFLDLDELNDIDLDPLVFNASDTDTGTDPDTPAPDVCIDPDNSNDDWGDNCQLRRFGTFAQTSYVEGMQRVLFCQDASLGSDITVFADGAFGEGTDMAVRDFQTANGLTVDGIVGPQTWGTMQSLLRAVSPDVNIGGIDYAQWAIEGCGLAVQFYQEIDGIELTNWRMADVPNSTVLVDFSSAPAN